MEFVELESYPGPIPVKPRVLFPVETKILWKSRGNSVILAVSARREGPDGDWYCQYDFASVVALPGDSWAPLDLVPHCSPVYDEHEVEFTLYSLAGETFPHIAVTTNHPACVPTDLYSFDPTGATYRRVRRKCTE